ncbi:PREDICTED: protein EPIDERMAL PATTERNING FACTOR 2-like [Nicotiana attenuata]|uniref:Epidermal patterning factor-like protein n=1 Tax=Nicotiana attenuata TaxID=49451 RepID=A0A314KMC4_NICAT|nr:PREDICTED: protein EPIDERMAL PATTERNING FACTOR 2-like [Nicotiana attenuata]OIT30460.1 protein epidermal patterning factor 2 [Nicotiana attenuata]
MVTTTHSFGFLILSIVTLVLMLVASTQSLRPYHFTYHGKGTNMDKQSHVHIKEERKGELGMELYPTGSSLPDCSHACGPCFPCKRVMVSFECSIAESCPIVYRCMCRGKYYHVPSN